MGPLAHTLKLSYRLCMRAHVLVVEDNPVLARPLVRLLSRSGHAVEHVDSCATALARAAVGQFDAGVFDIELGDGSGIELCSDLLTRGVVRSAVFYSGAFDPALVARARQIAPLVRKTDSADALRRVLGSVLRSTAEVSDVRWATGGPSQPGQRWT
jgi:DNA-binding response OmpR family regulator